MHEDSSNQRHRCFPGNNGQTASRLTVVNDALVQQLLHDLDGRVSLRGLLVFNQPVDELFGHEAVWVSSQVVPPILDHLPFVEPQPGRRQTRRRCKNE